MTAGEGGAWGVRVLLADDDDAARQALAAALAGRRDIEVVGHARDGRTVCQAVRALNPDVVVMRATLPVMSGLEATAWLREHCPSVRVVGLAACGDEALQAAMARAGAVRVLGRDAPAEEVTGAILGAVAAT